MNDLAYLPIRFRQKIRVDTETGCWIWVGARSSSGYGITNPTGTTDYVVAHRMVYAILVDADFPLQPGRKWADVMVLDHLCGVKACVNPDHLEPVTQRENMVRAFSRSCDEPKIVTEPVATVVTQTQPSLF